MKLGLLEIVFLLGSLCVLIVRQRYTRASEEAGPIVKSRHTPLDTFLFVTAMSAMMPVPLLYIFTPLLDFANYALPTPLRWPGVGFFIAGIFLFWRSHADLGLNWSGFPEIKEKHRLVTHGIYRRIRHPMYAAVLVWGVGQALVLTNWIAGMGNIVAGLLFLIVRAPREEAMLADHFGESYRVYIKKTGRIFPASGFAES